MEMVHRDDFAADHRGPAPPSSPAAPSQRRGRKRRKVCEQHADQISTATVGRSQFPHLMHRAPSSNLRGTLRTSNAVYNMSLLTMPPGQEPTDSALRAEYRRLKQAFVEGMERDRQDVQACLERERRFTVAYNRVSRNKVWAAVEGPECVYYNGSVEEYTSGSSKNGNNGSNEKDYIWPRGRHLHELSVFHQIWDFFRFMWHHTRPYKTVFLILLMSTIRPFQLAILAWLTQYIENHPQTTPIWLYFMGFFGHVFHRYLYWQYELEVPLNSQRVQLRVVLLKKRVRLEDSHPVALKWLPGRFNGLLKDVDDVINKIWHSCLQMFDDLVTIIFLLVVVFLNLAASVNKQEDASSYGSYVGVFLGLGLFTMGLPFVLFYFFDDTMQECETMIRDGQALYMSASNDRVMMGRSRKVSLRSSNGSTADSEGGEDDDDENQTAVQSYWIYGRTTFRSFFHQLAWETNYDLMIAILSPIVAYSLLTGESFGGSFGTSNIIIVLVALKDIAGLSVKLLDYLIKMSRGCNVLRDVAEVLNADEDAALEDLEGGGGGGFSCKGKEELVQWGSR